MVTDNVEQSQKITLPKTINPPPIFKESNLNFNNFTAKIKELTQPDGFECKISTKGIKLQTFNSGTYRPVVKFLKESHVTFHSFQNKKTKLYRIVIKNLHPSTDILFIKDELTSLGFQPRNIMNVLHRQTKSPFPMFFIDLEPDINNPDTFKLPLLCYSKIKVEAPRPSKDTPQCLRCHHTVIHALTGYCNHHPRCVRCSDPHDSSQCQKDRKSPHPANYKGCSVHKELSKNIKLLPSNPWRNNASNNQASSSSQEPQKNTDVEFHPLPQNIPKPFTQNT